MFGLALLCMVAAGIYIRLLHKTIYANPNADEGISFVAAACHQLDYSEFIRAVTGRWVPAREVQQLIRPSELCLGSIRDGLLETDVHPPLYFWILHVWLLIFGLSNASTVSLNAVFTVGTAVFLYLAGRNVFARHIDALFVAAIWLLSAAPLAAFRYARPYELLACVTALYTWHVVRNTEDRERTSAAALPLLALAAWLGMSTHFFFATVVLGSGIYMLARLGPGRRLATCVASVSAGVVVAYLVFPIHAMRHSGSGHLTPDSAAFARFWRQAYQLLRPAEPWFLAALTVACLAALWSWSLRRRGVASRPGMATAAGASLLSMVLGCFAFTALLHYSGALPKHVKGGTYLSHLWPLSAFVPVVILRLMPRLHWAGMLVVLVAIGSANIRRLPKGAMAVDALRSRLYSQNQIVVETANRLHLPRILYRVRADATVYRGGQKQMLNDYDTWRTPLEDAAWFAPSRVYDRPIRTALTARLREDGYRLKPSKKSRATQKIRIKKRRVARRARP